MIVLASNSASRRSMLSAAGISHEVISPEIDERLIEGGLTQCHPGQVAEALSVAKAYDVAKKNPERLVLGGDSLVVCGGHRFNKAASETEAAEHLRFFSGKTLELYSAAAIVQGNSCEWSTVSVAKLRVRQLSSGFIQTYLRSEWPEVSHCAGVFRFEALGVQLFERVDGDCFVVLGMPLIEVLGALRSLRVLQS